jgi:hypothetical protein
MEDPLRLSWGTSPPAAISNVVQKLQGVFPTLCVTSLHSQGLDFHVRGLVNEVVMRTMMARKDEIFGVGVAAGGSCVLGPRDFQSLSPLATGEGLTIRYLPNVPNRSQYLSGFWYY